MYPFLKITKPRITEVILHHNKFLFNTKKYTMKKLNYLCVIILLSGVLTNTNDLLGISKNDNAFLKEKFENHDKEKKKNNSKKSFVDLLNFEAIKSGSKVEVFWSVKSISNNKYFTLERSKNGVNFETVSNIDAANSTTDIIQYIETDFKPLEGISYYRIKLTDSYNTSSYSQVVMVNNPRDKNNMTIYPNPSTGDFKISLKSIENREVLVVLRDLEGKEYYSKVLIELENSEIIGIDLEKKLSPGTYIITATSKNILYSQKLIVR